MKRLYDLGVPDLHPVRRRWRPWIHEQAHAVQAAQVGWTELVNTRRPYKRLYRKYHRGGW